MRKVRVDFITNQAPHYRSALWKRLIGDEFLDVRFLFGEGRGKSIKPIDFSEANWKGHEWRLERVRNVYLRGVLVWQRGVIGHVRKTDAEALVLLGQMYVVSMWLAAWLAQRRGIRVLFWGHGAYGREGRIKRWFRARFQALADQVLVYGEHARRLLIADGVYPAQVRVVYNSLVHARQVQLRDSLVNPDFFVRQGWFDQPSAPVLLFIGRLTRQKSLDRLIAAVAELRAERRVFNVLFVGDGPERARLRALARTIPGQVHFYGACYEEDRLARLIANADLCVSPGEVGLTAMHALAYGTPVCTHGDMNYQMPEAEVVVEGRTGVLFDRQSMDIAGAIRRWFATGLDRAVVREACYREIDEKWNTENQARIIQKAILDSTNGSWSGG